MKLKMYQAKSIIYFAITSGFGYGVVMMLFILIFFSNIVLGFDAKILILILSLLLILSELLFYMFYINYSKSAWKKFIKMKISWISSKIAFSLLNFFTIIIFFSNWIFINSLIINNLSILFAAALSFVNLFCTAKIYLSYGILPKKNHSIIIIKYILNSLVSGAILLFFIFLLFEINNYFLSTFLKVLLTVTLFVELLYLYFVINKSRNSAKTKSEGYKTDNFEALDKKSKIKNDILIKSKEKFSLNSLIDQHFITIILSYILPIYILWNTPKLYINEEVSDIIYFLMLLFFIVGMLIEKKLFFAETRSVEGLYYGNK